MKATGIIRKLDELGRVVIPKETRVALGFTQGAAVEVSIDENDILVKKGDGSKAQVRKLDSLGRIVIPMSIRKMLALNESDRIEIFIEADSLIFRKYHLNCILCGNNDELIDIDNKKICRSCVGTIKKIKV